MPARTHTPLTGKRKRVCVSRSAASPPLPQADKRFLRRTQRRRCVNSWMLRRRILVQVRRGQFQISALPPPTASVLLTNKAADIWRNLEWQRSANVPKLPLLLGGSAKAESCTTLPTSRSPVMVSCTRW